MHHCSDYYPKQIYVCGCTCVRCNVIYSKEIHTWPFFIYVKEDFLANNPQLNYYVWQVFDSIFLHGTFRPEDMKDDLGIVLSGDSVTGNDPKINVNRDSYYRRNFGRPVLLSQTDNPNTEWRSTYGTVAGTRTHGTLQG